MAKTTPTKTQKMNKAVQQPNKSVQKPKKSVQKAKRIAPKVKKAQIEGEFVFTEEVQPGCGSEDCIL